ncbi:MAG TPA: hypothetical protein VJX73_16755 [Terracidiphilus sp.]|nr:hypothetical protein [Terracidiphilus sp.]
MLQAMQQPAPWQSSSSLSSFAGLLATLASSPPSPPSDAADAPLSNLSDLGEDVATLSYESALRAHARYAPANRDLARDAERVEGSPTPTSDQGGGARRDASFECGAAGATDAAGAVYASGAAVRADAAPGLHTDTARESDLRSASVTIRLSQAECERLHQRAAEAGLTVSAYLRSCAVEAEALREQVKQAIAELKAGTDGPSHPSGKASGGPGRDQGNKGAARRTFFGWIRWLTKRG